MNATESIGLLKQRMAGSIIGQEAMVERLVFGLLAERLPDFRLRAFMPRSAGVMCGDRSGDRCR
jgi:hypothetical protein